MQSQLVEQFRTECNTNLAKAKAALPALLALTEPRTVANTLTLYNQLLTDLSNASAHAGLFSEVHPSEEVRDAARDCEQQVAKFSTELSLNRDLYFALAAIDVSGADAKTKRFVETTLRDYRRSGIDLPAETRDRLQQIDEELTKLGQDFSKNISEDVRYIELDSLDDFAGLPGDFVESRKRGDNGKFRITTDYPDYNPFMTYAANDAARKALYIAFRSRGDQHNEAILAEVLKLRSEKARLLGFANWADYITEDKMIRSGSAASEFIGKVWQLATERAKADYQELLTELRKHQPNATKVCDWQKAWLENEVKKSQYEVDASEVRKYFPYQAVLAGLLDITATIYDLQYQEVRVPDIWHEDVLAYDVLSNSTPIGRIFLDMHPREGKYKHAAQFTLRDGVKDKQLPQGVLVCNFPDPKVAAQNGSVALLEHDDVVTMFHEFGHLMHHILGGNHEWIRQCGVATEWDFVEAPSQMFEEWAWNADTLAHFAKDPVTGETLPKSLVEKMQRADRFGLGSATVQQMYYAAISLEFHRNDPNTLDQLATVRALQAKMTPFEFVEGTRFHASFGHLVGYSAMYYTYMWSKVIAKDLLSPFGDGDLMATEVTKKYRDTILAQGGSKDAADLVRDFLGRDYNFAAFEQFLAQR